MKISNMLNNQNIILSKTTKQHVYNAANEYIKFGLIPTQKLIKQKLGKGSNTTIHKYLRQWFLECLRKTSNLNSIEDCNNIASEENRVLQQSLSRQVKQNEHYASELIFAEKTNIKLKEEINKLQAFNQDLQLRLTAVEATNNALRQTTQEINNRLDVNDNKIIQNMQQTIDDLRMELKTLNKTSLTALRETSNKGHETLMQEKVTSINLQAKIDSLTKELLENKKQSHEAIMTAQAQSRSLSRRNEQLQKIIQEHGLDKLPPLEEELRINFNKESKAYGK